MVVLGVLLAEGTSIWGASMSSWQAVKATADRASAAAPNIYVPIFFIVRLLSGFYFFVPVTLRFLTSHVSAPSADDAYLNAICTFLPS